MKTYGETFKALRTAKGISSTELVAGIISQSSLSKFENNKSKISINALILLLDKLNVKLDEFIFYTGKRSVNSLHSLQMKISRLHNENSPKSINALESLKEIHYQAWRQSKNRDELIYAILIESAIADNTQTKISVNSSEFIKRYLFEAEIWNQYELSILAGVISQLPADYQHYVATILPKLTTNKLIQTKYPNLLCFIMVHLIVGFIHEKNYVQGIKIVNLFKKSIAADASFSNRVHINYLQGICLMGAGKFELGVKIARKSISVLEYFNEPDIAQIETTFLESFIKEIDGPQQ